MKLFLTSAAALLLATLPALAQTPGGASIGMSGSGTSKQFQVLDAPGGQFLPFLDVDATNHTARLKPVAMPAIGGDIACAVGTATCSVTRIGAVPSDAMTISPQGTTRTLGGRATDFISVKDFGAKCDGATDDGPAFQAAVNAAPPGARLWVPPSATACAIATTVNVTKSLTFVGQGRQSGIFIPAATGFDITSNDVRFTDLRLYGTYSSSPSNIGILGQNASRLTVDHVAADQLYRLAQVQGGYAHRFSHLDLRNFRGSAFLLDRVANATTISTAAGSTTATLASAAGAVVNAAVVDTSGNGVLPSGVGEHITAISGTTVTLSSPATTTASNSPVSVGANGNDAFFDHVVSDVDVGMTARDGATAIFEPFATVAIQDYDAVTIGDGNDFLHGGTAAGVKVAPVAFGSSNHKFGSDSTYYDTTTGACIQLSPGPGTFVTRVFEANGWFSTCGRAFLIDGAGVMSGLDISGGEMHHMTYEAVLTNNTNPASGDIRINGVSMRSNNQGNVGASDVNFGGYLTRWELTGSSFGGGQGWGPTPTEANFVTVGSNASTGVIQGNVFNGTGTVGKIQGLTTSAIVTRLNQGFKTEAAGTASIPVGSNSVVVSHGLDRIPQIQDIGITENGGCGGCGELWVSAVTATTFTINSLNAISGNAANLSWRADLHF